MAIDGGEHVAAGHAHSSANANLQFSSLSTLCVSQHICVESATSFSIVPRTLADSPAYLQIVHQPARLHG